MQYEFFEVPLTKNPTNAFKDNNNEVKHLIKSADAVILCGYDWNLEDFLKKCSK